MNMNWSARKMNVVSKILEAVGMAKTKGLCDSDILSTVLRGTGRMGRHLGEVCAKNKDCSHIFCCTGTLLPSVRGTFSLHAAMPQWRWAIKVHEFSIYWCCSSCYSERLTAWYLSCIQLSDAVCSSFKNILYWKCTNTQNREIFTYVNISYF